MKPLILALASAFAISMHSGARAEGQQEDHAAHHPDQAAAPAPDKYEQQMKTMQDIHRKMQAAKTPEERSALMEEHMKAMKDGMNMMCEMNGSGEKPSTEARRPMKRCMAMKDMTMQMMMDREASQSAAPKH